MKVSDLVVRCLENEGVRYIFGIPGEETLDLMDSLSRSESIRFIAARHEQGAAFMANVYGRLSTYPGACLSTLGPGATNLITGIADAHLDRAPLVALTGQAALSRVFKESHQYLDVMRLFAPITKWNARVELPETVPEIMRKAFRLARIEKPGATHVELPEDIAAAPVEGAPLPVRRTNYPMARPATIERAVALLRDAERPVILAGNGVIRRQASDQLTELAQRLNIPVVTTFMGKGAINFDLPLAMPSMGLSSKEASLGPLEDADCIIAVGFDLVEWSPVIWNRGANRIVLHVDSLPAEVDSSYLPAVEVVGEIGDSLRMLLDSVEHEPWPEWDWSRFRDDVLKELTTADSSFPIKPPRLVCDLHDALGEEDVLISDVGAHKLWLATRYPAKRPNTVVIANGLASMGIAVPGAVAAKLVRPACKVVAVTGDGGFMMNSQELETAKRIGTPFVTVVLVDGRYGVIELNQKRRFGRGFGVEFGNPDFVDYAASFGLPGFRVEAADQLLPALRRALDLDVPSIIAVPVDMAQPAAAGAVASEH